MRKITAFPQKPLLLLFLLLQNAGKSQIHGLINENYAWIPKLIVCQNGKVGTYGTNCQFTLNISSSTTCNCNGAVFTYSGSNCLANSSSTVLPLVNNLQNIKQAAAFYNSSTNAYNAALDNNGVLYTWGDNNFGQLGTGNTQSVVTPTPVLSNVKKIVNIKNGDAQNVYPIDNDFMMVIKNDNSLWWWGSDYYGYSGSGSTGGFNPNPVQIMTNVKKVVCSGYMCIALKNDGTLWAWGNVSDLNEFCNTTYTQSILPPTKLDKFTTYITDFDFIQRYDCYLIALDNNNNVFYGYDFTFNNFKLKKLTFSNVANVYSGETMNYDISYFLRTNNGDVYTFGNLSYYLGTSSSNRDSIPKKIPTLNNIIEIYPSESKTYFLRQDGKLFFSGQQTMNEVNSCGTSASFLNTCEVYLGCNLLVGNQDYVLTPEQFKLFPNPGNDVLHLMMNIKEETEDIYVTDLTGKVIRVPLKTNQDKDYTLDIRQLPEGLYFANIKLKNYPAVAKKFFIQR